jgi:hypothetical protein
LFGYFFAFFFACESAEAIGFLFEPLSLFCFSIFCGVAGCLCARCHGRKAFKKGVAQKALPALFSLNTKEQKALIESKHFSRQSPALAHV